MLNKQGITKGATTSSKQIVTRGATMLNKQGVARGAANVKQGRSDNVEQRVPSKEC